MPVAPARHAGPPVLTHLACPRAVAWALFVFAWGCALLGLVVGVFARWVGFGVCATARVRLLVFALLGVGALVGWWDSVVPPPLCPACLLVCSRLWCGRCWRVRWCCVPDGRRVALLGRDMVVPPQTAWRWVARRLRCAGREALRVGCSPWCANARAHAERERGPRGADRGGLGGGLWVVARPVVARIGGDKCPKPRESKIDTTGAGAIVRSRPWWGFGGGCAWWLQFLVVALLPLGARRGGVGGGFLLVVGLGWW